MEAVLLTDFGSTFTKVVAVDVSKPQLLGYAQAHTTVMTDVNIGFESALNELIRLTGSIDFNKRLACSSAAGGLRMVAVGLVPELTAKAASMASMGAGAKIVGVYSYELTEDDINEIAVKSPDILLLTGGTDGGNKKCIIHNAQMLTDVPDEFPIIIAGNRSCGREVMNIHANRKTYLCDNVMPAIGTLNIEPARKLIRSIFLDRIVNAKGLGNEVLMPTPAAVLAASEMLAGKFGDLITIDVGGATTDVYSVADGTPRNAAAVYRGLPEPYAKRTVEGDIGMRYSAQGIVEAAGISQIAELSGYPEDKVIDKINNFKEHPESLPGNTKEKELDFALAAMAVKTATMRHAGTLEEVYTTSGRAFIQTGKDLTGVRKLIMTGGVLLNSTRQQELAGYALYNTGEPQSLRPEKAELYIDKHYIMATMGLLNGYDPDAALGLMEENIVKTEIKF